MCIIRGGAQVDFFSSSGSGSRFAGAAMIGWIKTERRLENRGFLVRG